MNKKNVRIEWSDFNKVFYVAVTTNGTEFLTVYSGIRDDCEVILKAFTKVGYNDSTKDYIRHSTHYGYKLMTTKVNPDVQV